MICQDDQRRMHVRDHRDPQLRRDLNGLDYVEVDNDQTTLTAYFIGKLPPQLRVDGPGLVDYLRIEGGRRVRDVRVVDVDPYPVDDPELDDALVVHVDKPGDFSTYTLRLVGVEGIDPRYDRADFSFKVNCPSDLDCATPNTCPPPALDEPEINYLARDYAGFRQLILDRLALIMPDWQERHLPDLGIALVELLAYVGDHLSYTQDAAATEAYLETARQRISVRRHARLVDYALHEGCNARAWLCLSVSEREFELDLARAFFVTRLDATLAAPQAVLTDEQLRQIPAAAYEAFEPLKREKATLRQARNEIHFYTWGQRDCCLPKGATAATLLDSWATSGGSPSQQASQKQAASQPPDYSQAPRALKLAPGDVLILEEVLGPKTGQPADADPARRHAVRLTRVETAVDTLVPQELKVNGATVHWPTPLLEVEWADEDALPFALCLSTLGPAPECQYLADVSVARGNVILVDHGRTVRPPEPLGIVPLDRALAHCLCEGEPGDVAYSAGRFHPRLERTPLTHREPMPADAHARRTWVAAARLTQQDPRAALPQITLRQTPAVPGDRGRFAVPLFELRDLDDPSRLVEQMRDRSSSHGARLRRKLSAGTEQRLDALAPDQGPPASLLDAVRRELGALLRTWEPRADLLGSGPNDRHFVAEIDNEGRGHLRFGDGALGERPPAGSAFYAGYRVGNGRSGNVGGEAIAHLVLIDMSVSGVSVQVRNPLPAIGGIDPEPLAEAKLYAPFTFRGRLERAVIAADYAEIARREFDRLLQEAAARLVWTGSWYEAEVAVDTRGTVAAADWLVQAVDGCLQRYRRMGHDLRVEGARYTPLDIGLEVCVKSAYLRGHVKAALLRLFSNRALGGGQRGFFHPDRFTFGDDVHLSRLIAAAQAVAGVESVTVTRLQRLYEASDQEIDNGVLPLGPFEIAQVDNDPSFPEHGRLTLVLKGGR